MGFSRVILISALVAAPVFAQSQSQVENRYSPDYDQCMDDSQGVTVNMLDCIGAEIDQQDARLNQAYVMVMRPLPKAKKGVLRQLQRTWIKRHDAKCKRDADAEGGGSLAGIIYSSCFLDETIKRTIFLENYKA